MLSKLKQHIAIGVLFVLAWSCAGLSFGMIGHAMGINDSGHDAAVHECCLVNTDDTSAAHTSAIDHHTPMVATLSIMDLLAVLLVAAVVTFFVTVYKVILTERWAGYARIWYERWSYFALYLTQLFSRGILHPKTW